MNVSFLSSNRAITQWKQPKIYVVQKVVEQLITVKLPDNWKSFNRVVRYSMIRQSQVGLKLWILSKFSKQHSESIRRARNLSVQWGSSFSRPRQKHQEQPYCASRRVSGELGISQFSSVRHFQDLGKNIRNSRIVPLGEYQVSSESLSSVRFVTFTTSAKISGTALLCLFESLRLARHLSVQWGSSLLRPRQKHPELSIFASRYQNIVKHLTYLSICLLAYHLNVRVRYAFTNNSTRTQVQFLRAIKQAELKKNSFSQTGWHTKVKEPSLLYYLSIAEERIVRFIPFPRVLALCEMQTASLKI